MITTHLLRRLTLFLLLWHLQLLAALGMSVSFLDGNASFRSSNQESWKALRVGQTLQPGGEIKTEEDTRLVLKLEDGAEIRVAPESHLKINPETKPQQKHYDLQLFLGKTWASVQKSLARRTQLLLKTAQAQIAIKGTSYSASVTSEATQLHVFSGKVDVQPPVLIGDSSGVQEISGPQEIVGPQEVSRAQWNQVVSSFQTLTITHQQSAPSPQRFSLDAVRDPWIDWNLQQDQK